MRKSKNYKSLVFGLVSIIAICSSASLNAASPASVVVSTNQQSGQQSVDSSSQNQNTNTNQNSGSTNVDSSSNGQTNTGSSNSGQSGIDTTSSNTDTSSSNKQNVNTNNNNNNNVVQSGASHSSKSTTTTHQSTYKPATEEVKDTSSETTTSSDNNDVNKVESNKEATNDDQFTKQIRHVDSKPTQTKKNENHLKTPKNVSASKDDESSKYKSDFKPIDSGKYFTSSILPWIGYGVLIALGVGGFLFLYKTRNAGTLRGMFTNLKTQLAKDIHHNPYSDHEEEGEEIVDGEDDEYAKVMEQAQSNKSLMANTLFSDNGTEDIFATKAINVNEENELKDSLSESQSNNLTENAEEIDQNDKTPAINLFENTNVISGDVNEKENKLSSSETQELNLKTDEEKIDEITKAFSEFSFSEDDLNSSDESLSRLDKKKDLFSVFKKR